MYISKNCGFKDMVYWPSHVSFVVDSELVGGVLSEYQGNCLNLIIALKVHVLQKPVKRLTSMYICNTLHTFNYISRALRYIIPLLKLYLYIQHNTRVYIWNVSTTLV